MQVWNVLHADRWKYRTQNIPKNSPSRHHCTTLSGYIFATKARIDKWKKNLLNSNISPTCSQYGELRPTSSWDRCGCLGHLSNLQRASCLGRVTAATSVNGSQPTFARCLAVSWAGTLYIRFRGLLPCNRILQGAKFTFVSKSSRSPVLAELLHGTRVAGLADINRADFNHWFKSWLKSNDFFSKKYVI